jgi:single-strand DNA-binding protein
MASLNKVFLIGNLTRMPELRYLPSGMAVCEFGIASSRKFTAGNGTNPQDAREDVCFVDIVVWGKQAESSGRYLEKGAPVFIEGRLQLDQWKDRETGGNRSRLRVVAERVQFLSRSDKGNVPDDYDAQPADGYEAPNQQQNPPAFQQAPSYHPAGNTPRSQPMQNAPRQAQSPRQPTATGGNRNSVPPMPEESFNVGDAADDDIPF